MKITRVSIIDAIERTLDLPCTEEQYAAWEGGMFIQDAMPQLRPDEREFILTGMTSEQWDQFCKNWESFDDLDPPAF